MYMFYETNAFKFNHFLFENHMYLEMIHIYGINTLIAKLPQFQGDYPCFKVMTK